MLTLKSYRRAAVPLLAIQTADPAEIIKLALKEATVEDGCYPVLSWDCIHGITALNETGLPLEALLNNNMEPAVSTSNPVEALRSLERLKAETSADKAIVVALGLGDILSDPSAGIPVRQALWNLRDALPQQGVLLVMTVPMGWRNPMPDDIAVLVAPLPGKKDLENIAGMICSNARVQEPSPKVCNQVSDALLGLSAFAAEQAIALSLSKQGINIDSLWVRKRQQISETPGLSVYAGRETFDDLGGLEQAKGLFRRLLQGKRKPGAIVFIDEGEKALAGSSSDTSGVAQDQLGCLLSYMQDQNASGAVFVGPPGAAKSALAKAIGNEGGIPTISFDLGGMKGSLVGESERRMRTALSVITAVSGGNPFFVMTCNAISILPPELRRRFTVGTMFFDLPTEEERDIIWNIYTKAYKLPKQKLPDTEGWTGAEIRQCADLADRLGMTLIEAAKFVVPVSVSAAEKIEKLRKDASERYLSASYAGVYKYQAPKAGGRRVNLD